MALEAEDMKFISFFLTFCLSGCTLALEQPAFSVFNTTLSLDKDCNLHIKNKTNESTMVIAFEVYKNCRIVTHPHTTIVNAQFVNGGYIVFVENNHTDVDECFSEYTAFKVDKTGKVKVPDLIKKSGSCFQSRESKDFEYFSSKLDG